MVNVGFWGDLESGKTKGLTRFGLECHEKGYVIESNYWTRFPVTPLCYRLRHIGLSWDGWCYSVKTHLDDYVDPKTGKVIRSMDGICWLGHEIHNEIDGRNYSSPKNKTLAGILYQVAKGGTSVGWDSPRFEDPDIRLRTVTPNAVMCIWGEDAWIELWDNQITGEFAPYEADKDVVKLIGRCYNTMERNL